jgi:asparagine synthase (glutamine-hydrolysing)
MSRYQQVLSLLPGTQVNGLFQCGVLDDKAGDAILDCWGNMTELMSSTDELGGLQFLEVRSTLPDELLLYADKLSMAHALELRVPYVDKEIVEYVERLPADFKVRNGRGKWLHKQLCRSFLPETIVKRRKRGFNCNVVDDWFRRALGSKMVEMFQEGGSRIYQYLEPSAVRKLLDEHASGRRDNHKVLFSLVVLEEWMRANQSPVAALK